MSDPTEKADPTPDDEFHAVCDVDDISGPMPRRVEIDGRGILLCRSGDEVFAVDEICPHENESMRYGVVQRGQIICPHHRYKFDLETGRCNKRCAPARLYEVRVDDGTVYVRAPRRRG